MIKIRYVKQAGITHCMAACLEMVYRFFDVDDIKQEDIWNRRKKVRPDGSAEYIETQALAEDLAANGFNVLTGKLDLRDEKCEQSLRKLLNNNLPIIAVKQWSKNKNLGHGVVLTGFENGKIFYQDPEIGKKIIGMDINDFIAEWQPTGKEKTGYPTQKPLGILRRIVSASSNPGDVVLDFFASSGTTGAAFLEAGRQFVLVDDNPQSIEVMRKRFADESDIEFC